jgi:uncharacterized tellurite resistance protein B-like protein
LGRQDTRRGIQSFRLENPFEPIWKIGTDVMERFEQLRNLVVMALADGSLGEHELSLLAERCSTLGMDEAELREAVHFALSDQASLRLPTDRDEQESLLVDLIRMMAADGVLSESEKRLFALAAAKMNFSAENVNLLIDRLLK